MANGDLEKLGVTADMISKRGVKIESLDLQEQDRTTLVSEKARPRLISGS
jgi:hypothetical protein